MMQDSMQDCKMPESWEDVAILEYEMMQDAEKFADCDAEFFGTIEF